VEGAVFDTWAPWALCVVWCYVCNRLAWSHVASHSRSEAGRCRCLWNISSQLTCPTLGMVSVLGSSEAWDWRILRSREMGGTEAIVFGIRFSIFLHAERPLRRGSIARRILRRWEMDWVMSLWVVHVCRM